MKKKNENASYPVWAPSASCAYCAPDTADVIWTEEDADDELKYKKEKRNENRDRNGFFFSSRGG